MRFYGFGNYYLSSLQQGLQASHAKDEIENKYPHESEGYQLLDTWRRKHKTIILLNGGNADSLKALHKLFKKFHKAGMELPFAKFHEDEQSLNGALTSVGIVLTERYYNAPEWVLETNVEWEELNSYVDTEESEFLLSGVENLWKYWEVALVQELKKYRLAS